MTWKEFKEMMDKKIEELKLEQSVEIGYIDFHGSPSVIFCNSDEEYKEICVL